MGWFQRYLELFEGEPGWVIFLVSMLMLTGLVVIVEKLLKLSTWIFAISLIVGTMFFVLVLLLFW